MPLAKELYSGLKKIFNKIIESFLHSTLMKKFARKYPRVYKFFLNRFSLNEFTGLTLTFLVLSFITNVILLNEIVETFVRSSPILSIDQSFAKLMYHLRVTWLVEVFYWFSKLGSFPYVVTVAVLSTIAMWNKKAYIIPVWISLLGSDLTMHLAKNYFHRARPEAYWYYHEVDFSFPSGHATISVAFYGALFYVIFRTRKKYASKFRWMIPGFFFVLLLGFSRLYLCVHYLSDVLAGYSLGLLWLLLAISMNEWILHRKKKRETTNTK